jgi:hypothetical protein
LAPKRHEFEHDVDLDVEARVRQGVKAVLEEVLQDPRTFGPGRSGRTGQMA